MLKWEIAVMLVTLEHMLNETTKQKVKQLAVDLEDVDQEIMTQEVAKQVRAVLDTALTFVVVYFL
ncbi:hypothetical protein [Pseudalkalibacillus hwajinpoensis]|uniref:hypothetical protein n=2 Tax=Guptibacillus hwajinpoensis TaxID=208199 RepID=UPI00384B52E1